jgi:hypothetical protein
MQFNFSVLLAETLKLIPKAIGAIVVLIVGYIVSKAVAGLVRRGLTRVGLDRSVSRSPGGNIVGKITQSPSGLTGRVVFWVLWLGVISLAVAVLGIPGLTTVIAAIYAYLPNVIAALLILLVAGAVSAAIGGLVGRAMGDTPTGRMLATIVPGIVFSIAIFMALNQLGIAEQIVTITYAAILGSLALGAALAFGLGGRDVASRLLEQAYTKGQQQTFQFRQDLATGKARAGEMANEAREQIQGEAQPARRTGVPAPGFGETIESTDNAKRVTRRRRQNMD